MAKGTRRAQGLGQGASTKSPNPREKKSRRTEDVSEEMETEDSETAKKLLPAFEEHSIEPLLRALKFGDPLPDPKWGSKVPTTTKWSQFGIKAAQPFDTTNIFGEDTSCFHESVKILKYPPGPGNWLFRNQLSTLFYRS